MVLLTGILLAMLHKRSKEASTRSNSKTPAQRSASAVTIALTVNSVLYTMFAALQLFLFIVGNKLMGQKWVIPVAHTSSSIGAAIRALSYLVIPTMRNALKKATENFWGK
ncbi:uncharacterized protein LOC134848563 [Symsagittifera roscoffensis]|uniref:uncharacterized protein LOC134848563 n=1 Tax=Symsagittifera roscoffensis TaxID=84072 RepID=UPI00307B1C3B